MGGYTELAGVLTEYTYIDTSESCNARPNPGEHAYKGSLNKAEIAAKRDNPKKNYKGQEGKKKI